jgi:hypothetical protein
LAFWARALTARIVGDPLIAAIVALLDVTAQRRRSTPFDRSRNVSTTLRQPAFEFKLGFPDFGLAG